MTTITVDGVDAWQRVGSASFVPLHCSEAGESFSASISQSRWGDELSIARVQTGPVLVRRTDELVARSTHDDLHLAVQVRSTGRIHQHGRAVRMSPGTGVLYETHRPYVIDHRGTAQDLYVVHVARDALGLKSDELERVAARPLSAALPAMRLLTTTLRELDLAGSTPVTGQRSPRSMTDGVGGVVATLARLVLHAALDEVFVPSSDDELAAAVRVTIRECAADPEFDVAALAERHHVSERQLYRVLAGSGLTPSAAIRAERLARAQALLAEAAGRAAGRAATSGERRGPATVEAIAHASGFRDATTCIRAFKREFGVTPGSMLAGE